MGEDSVAASSSSRNLQRKKGVSEPGRKSFRTKCPPGRRNIHSDHPHIRRSPLLLAGKSDQFWAGSWGEWEGLTMPVLRRGSWPLVAGSVASRGWCRQLRFSEGAFLRAPTQTPQNGKAAPPSKPKRGEEHRPAESPDCAAKSDRVVVETVCMRLPPPAVVVFCVSCVFCGGICSGQQRLEQQRQPRQRGLVDLFASVFFAFVSPSDVSRRTHRRGEPERVTNRARGGQGRERKRKTNGVEM